MDVLFSRVFLLKISDRTTVSSWSRLWCPYGLFGLKKHISWRGITSLFQCHWKAFVWWFVVSCLVLVNVEIYMCAVKRKIMEMQVIKIRDMQVTEKNLHPMYRFSGSFERCVPSNKGEKKKTRDLCRRQEIQNRKATKGIPK